MAVLVESLDRAGVGRMDGCADRLLRTRSSSTAVMPAAGVLRRDAPARAASARRIWPTGSTSGSTGGCSVRHRPCATPTCQRSPLDGRCSRMLDRSTWSCRSCRRPTIWEGPPPRHGVWAIAPMDDGRPASAPSRFWEVRGAHRHSQHGGRRRRGRRRASDRRRPARADPLSLTRTRDAAAWTSARLVLRCLRSLQRDGGRVPAWRRSRGTPEPALTGRNGQPCRADGGAGRRGQEPHGLAPRASGSSQRGRERPTPRARRAHASDFRIPPGATSATRSPSRSTAATSCSSRTIPTATAAG